MFDYFVAELRCPECGAVSPADHTTRIQTKARRKMTLAFLGVGDALTTDRMDLVGAGYIPLNPPQPGEAVRLVEQWFCPSCETRSNWVEIVVSDGVITAMEALPGIGPRLEAANYIVDWLLDEIDDEGPHADLYERLAAAEREAGAEWRARSET